MKKGSDALVIMIAGPYTSESEQQQNGNLNKLNRIAAMVFKKGHIPIIGLNAALPFIEFIDKDYQKETIMKISLALAERCDAILMVGESPGANQERSVFLKKGFPIFYHIDEISNGAINSNIFD